MVRVRPRGLGSPMYALWGNMPKSDNIMLTAVGSIFMVMCVRDSYLIQFH